MARDVAEPPDQEGADGARFTVTARTGPGPAVLSLGGELDHDTAAALHDALQACVGARPPRILVDCADLRFCDSTGLNVLLRGRLAALEVGTTVELSALRPPVARMFEITGASSVFPTYRTLDEALAHES